MKDIPGTVTFLFTDIEGSTKLAQEFAEKMFQSLFRHNEILRQTIESHNGFIFNNIGDALCCAFANADDAIKAAYEAQLKLNSEKWDEVKLKVRMGIHSGKAEWSGTDYMGYVTLSRINRVMSAAYGEQILISNDTYKLVKEKFTVTNREIGNEGNKCIMVKQNRMSIYRDEKICI